MTKLKERKLEAPVTGSPSRFECVLLQEGLGNFGDAFYYTKEALASAVPVFEGKKIYANHPTATEEQEQPERSVKDILGHFESVKAVEVGGRVELQGIVVIPPGAQFDGARALMQHALEYAKKFPGKDFVGLSINASGDADEVTLDEIMKQAPEVCQPKLLQAKEMGIQTVRATKVITDATSCDLVTEAGAGGKILKLLEAAKRRKKDMAKKENANPAADKDHADKDQDIALIKQMLDKHLGDGEHDEADAGMMQKALKAYQAMGHEGEEAEKMAALHVKACKHMAAENESEAEAETEAEGEKKEDESESEAEAEGEKKEDESEAEGEGGGEDADADADADADDKKKKKPAPVAPAPKEAAKIVALTAENAALKEKLAKVELANHIESKLEASKLPRSATKLLRESVKGVKTAKEFDAFLKIFVESRKHALGEADGGFGDVFVNPERVTVQADSSSELSFADAAEE